MCQKRLAITTQIFPTLAMNNAEHSTEYLDDEITFADLMDYLQESWRVLVAGALVGAMLTSGLVAALAKYKAEIVLDNIEVIGNRSLSFTGWRILSETLPLLASQLDEVANPSKHGAEEASWLASSKWWEKNVVPTYGLSKGDAKEFPAMADSLKDQYTTITNIKITYESRNETAALTRAERTADFIKRTALFSNLKSMVAAYSNESIATALNNKKALTTKEIELSYAQKRVEALKKLIEDQKTQPLSEKISIDIQNGQGRYLPLQTQLNAELIGLDEIYIDIERLNDQLAQNEELEKFATSATRLLESTPALDGPSLLDGLLKIEQQMSANIPTDDLIRRVVTTRIHGDLIATQMRFSSQMPVISSTVSKSVPWLQALAGGLFGGTFIAALVALIMRKYRTYQKQLEQSAA